MVNRDYKCSQCGKKISEKVSIKENVKKVCPYCGGKLKMVFNTKNDIYWFNNPFMGAITRKHGNN